MSSHEKPEVCLFEPRDPRDISVIEMALAGTEIVYHIDNRRYAEAAGSPAVGDASMRLWVRADQADAARALLKGQLPI